MVATATALQPQRAGRAGNLIWVRIGDIQIDNDYQRYMNKKSVDRIVREYDPDVFGVLVCSRRIGGGIYALDGQHRRNAAEELFGLDGVVPCFVVDGLDKQHEAAIFWKLNKHRLNPTSADTFRARLAAEEPVAIEIKRIVDGLGVTMQLYPQPLGPKDVGAFSAIESLHRDGSLEPVMQTLLASWPNEPGVLKASNLNGVQMFFRMFYREFFLDTKYAEARKDRLVAVLGVITPRDVERRAAIYQESLNTRKATAVARSLYYFYQRGLKGGKLKLPAWGMDDGDDRVVIIADEPDAEAV